jgi:ATP-dependent protease ClpP protease subunit
MSVLNFEKGKIEVKNQGDRIKLIIYGEIVSKELDKWIDEDVAPKDIQDLLYQIGDKDLDIYINSVGGSVFAGMAIYNMLKRHKGYKTVYVDGVAASIASVIAMVGDKIYIPKNSFLMVHKAWCVATGNSDDLIKLSGLRRRDP